MVYDQEQHFPCAVCGAVDAASGVDWEDSVNELRCTEHRAAKPDLTTKVVLVITGPDATSEEVVEELSGALEDVRDANRDLDFEWSWAVVSPEEG